MMSNSGSGRGRGWLNLKSNQTVLSTPLVGSIANPSMTVPSCYVEKEETEFADVVEEVDLVCRVKQLNVNDDGILFNQKIRYILDEWKQTCQTKEEVEQSFDTLFQACLNDTELASKLVFMIASRTFITQEVHSENIRLLFLRKLQNNFDGSQNLQKSNPVAFRNSVQLLGEFYNKARLANGLQLTFLMNPLISYLEMLLEESHIQDLQLFTSQLYLNGSAVKLQLPERFGELLNRVRFLLVSDKNLTKEGKLWLLLALEVASNRFAILPAEINQFYKTELGDSAIASFQGTHCSLSVQTTQANKKLDNYQSNVNVLQVSSVDSSKDLTSPSGYSSSDLNSTSQLVSSNSSGVGSESGLSVQSSNVSRKETSGAAKSASNRAENAAAAKHAESAVAAKHGRPILGAGVRLHKYKTTDESKNSSNSNWRDKKNSSGWNNKPKTGSGWGDNKKNAKSLGADERFENKNAKPNNKGWEHDDRFENSYS